MALLAAGQALLQPVCERLINTALEEYALVRGVKEEIQKLRSTVRIIEDVLQDAEGKQVGSKVVRSWLSSLKQILFDAQDVLDEVATDAALERRDRRLVRACNVVGAKVRNIVCCFGTVHNLLADRGIAHQIKHIREMLDAKSNEISTLGLERLGVGTMSEFSRHRRPPTSSLPDSDIIGRDDEKKSLEELLLLEGCADGTEGSSSSSSSNNNVHVITVTGMGGVGKTTLVSLVYDSPRVKQHFHPTIWVCVSNDFDLERISGEIMDAITTSDKVEEPHKITNWNKSQIRIKEKIEGKRFLLVLDDMWEENDHDKWERLCKPLRYGGKGSKIVVTARSQKVSHMVRGTHIPLAILSSENLWSTFERFAFEGCDDPNKRALLEHVGRQIADKLKGLPLAAKIVGRLLNARLDVRYWQSILRSERWAQSSDDPNDILPILKLSYDQLPGHLKQCFAYCSLFPKDYSFSKDELVQLWTAQNFIHVLRGPHADQSDMNENFDALLHTSFFEQSSGDEQNSGEEFVMHDLIHDLAESVSEDDSFKVVQNDRNEKICETVRHVSIVTDSFDPMRLDELCKLRTLLFLRPCQFVDLNLDALFMKFKRLRVLSLHRCKIKELPESIGTLKHLRYVDLSSTLITMLPESICNLHNLQVDQLMEALFTSYHLCNTFIPLFNRQVVKLGGCRLLDSLPRNMSALVNLSHLVVDNELVSNYVQHLGKLTALQELIVTGGKLKELAHMGMLRQLRIRRMEEVTSKEDALQASLETKVHLDVLELRWSDDRPYQDPSLLHDQEVADALQPVNSIRELLVKNYGGISSPRWMEGPSWASASTTFQLLQRVELEDCKNWEVLPPLSQLPCLKFLKIQGMSAVTRIGPQFFSCCEDGSGGGVRLQPGFQSLEELEFRYMTEWEEWEAPPHQQLLLLPRLHNLLIYNCMKLKELPPLPPTLDDLTIEFVGLTHLPGWMRCFDIDGGGGGGFDVTPSTWSSSPSLSYLSIGDCPNLTSLGNGLLQQPLPTLKYLSVSGCPELASLRDTQFRHLTSLETLIITDCPKLSLPPSATKEDALPSSLQHVDIHGCGDMTGEDLLLASIQNLTSLSTLEMDVGSPDTMAAVGQLTSLTSLAIVGGSHVDDTALSTCLRGLTSLKYLSIFNCSAITTLAFSSEEVRRRLIALEGFHIDNCPKLLHLGDVSPKTLWIRSSSPEQITMWLRQCPALKELSIDECPQLTCIDGELEMALLDLAPSLRDLHFWYCENLRVLPAMLRNLSSLDRLAIFGCPKIESLPSAGLPKSLDYLQISECPELVDRCKKKGCPDWPLLSHIRIVDIEDESSYYTWF